MKYNYVPSNEVMTRFRKKIYETMVANGGKCSFAKLACDLRSYMIEETEIILGIGFARDYQKILLKEVLAQLEDEGMLCRREKKPYFRYTIGPGVPEGFPPTNILDRIVLAIEEDEQGLVRLKVA